MSEANSWDGITVGLVETIITISRVLNDRLNKEAKRMKRQNDNGFEHEWFSQEVQDALLELKFSEDVRSLLYPRDEQAMKIIHEAASLLKGDFK